MAVAIVTASVGSDAMAEQLMGIWVRMATAMARRYAVLRPVPSMRGLRQRKDETCCEPMTQEPYEPATSARK
ncbi:hypothetical protein CUAC110533_07010 [Cutibacterium acnes subsp. elongatum]